MDTEAYEWTASTLTLALQTAAPEATWKTATINDWSAIMWARNADGNGGQFYDGPRFDNLEIEDRVGGGDGFASGFFYGLLNGESPEEALRLGWAHGALLTTFPGDTTMATVEQVRAFARGGSARIQR